MSSRKYKLMFLVCFFLDLHSHLCQTFRYVELFFFLKILFLTLDFTNKIFTDLALYSIGALNLHILSKLQQLFVDFSNSPFQESLISSGILLLPIHIMIMMNCFCGMVHQQKEFRLISSWDHCQRSSPSHTSNMPQAGFEPVQNLSSGFVE